MSKIFFAFSWKEIKHNSKIVVMPRPKSGKKTEAIRVEERISRMIAVICVAESTSTSELISPILEKALKQRYMQAAEKLAKEAQDIGK